MHVLTIVLFNVDEMAEVIADRKWEKSGGSVGFPEILAGLVGSPAKDADDADVTMFVTAEAAGVAWGNWRVPALY